MKKRMMSLALTAVAALGLSAGGAALANPIPSEQVTVYKAPLQFEAEGERYTLPEEQSGFIYRNHTYVPFRFAAYTLGLQVQWENETSTVRVSEPNAEMQRVIEKARSAYKMEDEGAQAVGSDEVEKQKIRIYFRDVNYVLFGEEKEPPAELRSFIYKNTLYVPIRFFAESMGIDVNWNQDAYTVSFVLPVLPEPEEEQKADPVQLEEEEEAAAEPAPAPGSSAPGGSPAPAPAKPSYEEITGEAEADLYQLKASCENRLIGIYRDWKDAESEEEMAQHFARGQAAFADCKQKFESILSQTESKLSNHGYSTEIIQEYRRVFEQTIADAIDRLS